MPPHCRALYTLPAFLLCFWYHDSFHALFPVFLLLLRFLFTCTQYVSWFAAPAQFPAFLALLCFMLSCSYNDFFPFPLCNRSILGNNYYHHHICCTNTRARTLPLLYYKGTLPLLCYKSKAQQIQKLNCIILRRGEGGEGVKRESEVWWHVLCIRPQAL